MFPPLLTRARRKFAVRKIFIFMKKIVCHSRKISVRTAARRWCTLVKQEFTQFVKQYEHLVYTVCLRFVRSEAAAQDLTQETFLSAWLHRQSCPKGYERHWLSRIAANKCKDHLQSAWSRHVELPGEDGIPSVLSPPAEEIALSALQAKAAQRAIEAFPEPYGSVLRLCLLEQRTVEETAAILNRPPKTVYTQFHRGKKLLREQLERGTPHV